jgi:hypothetical protein
MRAALSAFGGCVARVLQKSARYCARTSTRASARARSTGPCIGGVVEQRQSRRQGTRELKPTGYLFPSSTCQVNLDGPAQAGSWSGLRRGGGREVGASRIS